MKDSARYAKVVEWSEPDGCYIGRAPGLMDGGVHGDDERTVFSNLCDAVEEVIELYREDGKPLPPSTLGTVALLGTYQDEGRENVRNAGGKIEKAAGRHK